ncbi:putative S-adenosyl-L-methionine-dependent methyltransferase-domain-containing protein [Lactarius deliciosus]|nr:putative S-adenosyl-L-methionine-dependent methyltransferase-domain-containing protein [Lactarius deliciosus]
MSRGHGPATVRGEERTEKEKRKELNEAVIATSVQGESHGGGPHATAGVRAAVERAASGWRRGWHGAWRYVVLYCTSSPSLVTAVEKILLDTIKISQAFGEARDPFLSLTNDDNEPSGGRVALGYLHNIQLVELGPGKGTLVDDILQNSTDFVTIAPISRFHQRRPPCGVKSVPPCCTAEETRWDGKNGLRIHWHDSIDDIPAANGIYTMLVAHEFFDALPFHLIEKTHQGWKEVLITSARDPAAKTILRPSSPSPLASATPSLDLSASTPRTCFRPDLAAEPTPVSTLLGTSSPRFTSLPIGTRIEVSATSFQTARKLGTLVSQGVGGSALVIDFGADHAVGNSFRAFKGHALVDPFDCPGQADLTANSTPPTPSPPPRTAPPHHHADSRAHAPSATHRHHPNTARKTPQPPTRCDATSTRHARPATSQPATPHSPRKKDNHNPVCGHENALHLQTARLSDVCLKRPHTLQDTAQHYRPLEPPPPARCTDTAAAVASSPPQTALNQLYHSTTTPAHASILPRCQDSIQDSATANLPPRHAATPARCGGVSNMARKTPRPPTRPHVTTDTIATTRRAAPPPSHSTTTPTRHASPNTARKSLPPTPCDPPRGAELCDLGPTTTATITVALVPYLVPAGTSWYQLKKQCVKTLMKKDVEFLHVQSMMDNLPLSVAWPAALRRPLMKVAGGTGRESSGSIEGMTPERVGRQRSRSSETGRFSEGSSARVPAVRDRREASSCPTSMGILLCFFATALRIHEVSERETRRGDKSGILELSDRGVGLKSTRIPQKREVIT